MFSHTWSHLLFFKYPFLFYEEALIWPACRISFLECNFPSYLGEKEIFLSPHKFFADTKEEKEGNIITLKKKQGEERIKIFRKCGQMEARRKEAESCKRKRKDTTDGLISKKHKD